MIKFIREFIKDIQDYEGDKYYNIKTLPVRIGQQKSINITIFMIIVYCILILIPYFINYYQTNYLISLIILVGYSRLKKPLSNSLLIHLMVSTYMAVVVTKL